MQERGSHRAAGPAQQQLGPEGASQQGGGWRPREVPAGHRFSAISAGASQGARGSADLWDFAAIGMQLAAAPQPEDVISAFVGLLRDIGVPVARAAVQFVRYEASGRGRAHLKVPALLGQALLAARRRLAGTHPNVTLDVWRGMQERRWAQQCRQQGHQQQHSCQRQPGRADTAICWRQHAAAPAMGRPSGGSDHHSGLANSGCTMGSTDAAGLGMDAGGAAPTAAAFGLDGGAHFGDVMAEEAVQQGVVAADGRVAGQEEMHAVASAVMQSAGLLLPAAREGCQPVRAAAEEEAPPAQPSSVSDVAGAALAAVHELPSAGDVRLEPPHASADAASTSLPAGWYLAERIVDQELRRWANKHGSGHTVRYRVRFAGHGPERDEWKRAGDLSQPLLDAWEHQQQAAGPGGPAGQEGLSTGGAAPAAPAAPTPAAPRSGGGGSGAGAGGAAARWARRLRSAAQASQ